MADEFLPEEEKSFESDEELVRRYLEREISDGGQDSPLSQEECNAKARDCQGKKEASRDKWLRKMEEHARCALLPSPEKLNESISSPGSDKTDTLVDYELLKDWVTKKQLLNTDFYGTIEQQRQQLETCEFGSLITLAFSNAFAAMRNTASPELPELVFWYYAGHGLGKEKAETLCYSSTPRLSEVGLIPNYNDAANDFVKEDRKVKGGELFLHKVGFCDLYGLLKPWIAAVKAESINAKGATKKNKHLVIILDSCHSGIIAQELKEFKNHAQEIDPTLLAENSITIQAACGPDERTFGGYFTPCFIYLNDPENAGLLSELKHQWKNMEEQQKTEYRSINLPSPMVVTTRPQSACLSWCCRCTQSQPATMKVKVQNFKLTLFQDPGFFKFCSIKVYQHQDIKFKDIKDRVLDPYLASAFMSSRRFTVLDYRLKTYKGQGAGDRHAGTPMGLFLLEDPANPGLVVCAHIHFAIGDTATPKRINLVHHKKPPAGSAVFIHDEDHDGLSELQIEEGCHKIKVNLDKDAKALVQECEKYVNDKEPDRWEDDTQWNMTGDSFHGKFRLQERSAWEDDYLKYIEKFNLPKVAV